MLDFFHFLDFYLLQHFFTLLGVDETGTDPEIFQLLLRFQKSGGPEIVQKGGPKRGSKRGSKTGSKNGSENGTRKGPAHGAEQCQPRSRAGPAPVQNGAQSRAEPWWETRRMVWVRAVYHVAPRRLPAREGSTMARIRHVEGQKRVQNGSRKGSKPGLERGQNVYLGPQNRGAQKDLAGREGRNVIQSRPKPTL